jgi:hypothetical protein
MSEESWRPDPLVLAEGRAPVYVATKLFEYSGRLLSASVEEALVRGLRRGSCRSAIATRRWTRRSPRAG